MSNPSSQVLASWALDELSSTSWIPLRDLVVTAMKRRLGGRSETAIEDLADSNLAFVAEHLRDQLAEGLIDGSVLRFEIDDEPKPYLRSTQPFSSDLLTKLTKIDPYRFEDVCADVLARMGAKANATQRTNDGGVDFVALDLKIAACPLELPKSCQTAVIGQAKRHRLGRLVRETTLREFVGASHLHRHKMIMEEKLWPLTPVIYAFWTTSDFEPKAKEYGRRIGLWFMDGATLAAYVTHLEMTEYIMQLPDGPPVPAELPPQENMPSEMAFQSEAEPIEESIS